MPVSGDDYKYWAFISYSHRDKKWGDWLHQSLETYRVPRRLVGRAIPEGQVPRRLLPIFRDREELPSSADLSNNIDAALRQSRALIVICSPSAASSRWVNEEILSFKRLGREGRILACIVDGEPNASDHPELGEPECFPAALRHRVSERGEILPERVEPIAADARPDKDGKANARLKLLAGLLGVPYDELRQRERQRRLRRRLTWTAAAAVLAASAAGVWHWKAQKDLISAEVDRGRQALFSADPLAAATYLADAYRRGDDSAATRLMLAEATGSPQAGLREWSAQDGNLLMAQFSADGKTLFTAGDSTIKQWDTASAGLLRTLTGAQGCPCPKVAFAYLNDGGDRIIAGFEDQTLKIFDAGSGTLLAQILDTDGLWKAALSPDGKLAFVMTGDRNHARLWDLQGKRPVAKFESEYEWYREAFFSADSSLIYAYGGDETLRAWSTASGKLMFSVPLHGRVVGARLTDDGHGIMIWTSARKAVQVWDSRTGKPQRTLHATGEEPSYLWPGANAGRYVANTTYGSISVINPETGAEQPMRLPHDEQFAGFTTDTAMPRLLVSESNGLIGFRDMSNGEMLAWADTHGAQPAGMESSRDGKRAVAYRDDGVVIVWELSSYPVVRAVHGSFDETRLSHDGSHIAVSMDKGDAWYQAGADTPLWSRQVCERYGGLIQLSPDDQYLTVDCNSGNVRVLKTADGSQIAAFPEDFKTEAVRTYMSADGRYLLIEAYLAGKPGAWHIYLWDRQHPQEFTPQPKLEHGMVLDFVSKGHRLMLETKDQLEVWDLDGGVLTASIPKTKTSSDQDEYFSGADEVIVVTQDGTLETVKIRDGKTTVSSRALGKPVVHAIFHAGRRRLLSLNKESADLWDVDSGAHLATLQPLVGATFFADADGGSSPLAFSADGRFIVGGAGNTLAIWDADDGRLLVKLGEGADQVNGVEFSPDGSYVLSHTIKEFRLWDTRLESHTPTEMADWVACHSPWRMIGDTLVHASPDTSACRSL